NMMGLYNKAKTEGVETSMIWLINKLKSVALNIPKEMNSNQAIRKIIKITAGVIMHQTLELGNEITEEERTKKLNDAIHLGYCYGITYPFIDDLFDSKVLSPKEDKQYSELIKETLVTGIVPDLGEWSGENINLIKYIHGELKVAFEYIKDYQSDERMEGFLNQCYIFYKSQEDDRIKALDNSNYTNEEIYIPIILKSASSRLIVRSVISADEDDGFESRTFFYGIYNQLADDFTDMFEDSNNGVVTPYTYYMKYHKTRKDIINPFELFWAVISNLIHNVYKSDSKTCEVILSRAINSLKRCRERLGSEKYIEVMSMFALQDANFNKLIDNMVNKASDVEFFDKLIRDNMISIIKKERDEKEEFLDTIDIARNQINSSLSICTSESNKLIKDVIINAANYSLEGDGKRLRPIIAWFMATKEYGLREDSIQPILKSLEYMHTASLLLDDLPSQDNANARRGRKTLHEVYDVATVELTSIFLTQQAIQEQTLLDSFDCKNVIKLIKYSTKVAKDMCSGQWIDLNSKGKPLTLEELKNMCFYKTGIAFEACLMMPAILANKNELEIEALKKFARFAGIAFQIKDDILDLCGDRNLMGKNTGIDAENNNSTFVSILGKESAEKELWEHYCLAMEALKDITLNTNFLKQLMSYIVNRDH
ncbi:MAG: polyprenyl synthetase family protein, partial [Clostridium sp.]